ncbi:MAG: hypothetical protein IJ427_04430 [Lachnospiraceae bacterium]|nr:hypothetical protein [Lachnospiraceae bacterium]
MFSGTVEELKSFMALLLRGELFDAWEVTEAKVETFFELSVNGRLKKDFFEEPETVQRDFAKWGDVKEIFFQAIKGKRLPGMLRIVLAADRTWTERILEECGKAREEAGASLYLNIRYSANGCQLVSGVSHAGFTMDKTLDLAWDAALQGFLKKNGIIVSTQ